ncbi:SusC/RagA family TonB-linked outer membrane protein [Mucilaginibacter terrae]|uniref:TonB-linked SusC/RagA family outer membrane protein n=1 Tax=Mucilaginibacter terrae TaxID=1955052 RepID=A0ABU3GN44_9SPHI|nr:SusC/RagA family TonB-linked outer membrane protein [Mucilaginibacter terrae]MDT3401198.1 TonB-linked SusC/RagA family outer membrane protein [Mucilaginibacter terrae]
MRIFTMIKHCKTLFYVFLIFIPILSSAQTVQVTGLVIDSLTNEGLPGASVSVKGKSFQTATTIDGKFTISANLEDILQVHFIGYVTKEVKVKGSEVLTIALKKTQGSLDEVVVMAYNPTVKRKVVASVTNVDVKQIETLAGYKDLGTALQGRVAGVLITNTQGGPNASPGISIRGAGDPMYVVDGIVQDKGFFQRLNPQDIESLTIMKDAASSAVYGATAANGVIVVQTKRGKTGSTRLNYTLDNQFNTPTLLNKKLTALQRAQTDNAIYDYMGSVKPYSDDILNIIRNGGNNQYPNNDWNDLLVKKNALSQRHTFTLDGGNETTQYRTSAMIYNQGTLQKKIAGDNDPIDYKTYSADINMTSNFRKAGVKLGFDFKPYLTDNKVFGGDPWLTLQSVSALAKAYNTNGSYAPNSPVAAFADTRAGYVKVFNYGSDFRGNLDWQIPYIKGLKATFTGNFGYASGRTKTWSASVQTYNEDGSAVTIPTPQLTMLNSYGWRYEINTGFAYDTKIAKDHSLSAGLYFNQRETYDESTTAKRINYFDNLDQLNAGPVDGQTTAGSAGESGRLGYIGVLNYDYKGKYLLSSTFRYDGTDAYADGSRWGFFPSAALGYVISEEGFFRSFRDKTSMDLLKIRGSIGQIGETSSRFAYLSGWSVNPTGAYIGGVTVPTILPGQLASSDLTWYTTTMWNAGFDFAFFNNRLSGSADYFFRRTTGFLINPVNVYNSTLGNLTGTSGSSYVYGLPRVRSDDAFRRAGAEFQINWQDRKGAWNYSIGANLTMYDELWEKYAAVDDATQVLNPKTRQTYRTKGLGGTAYDYLGLFRNSHDLLNNVIATTGATLMAGDAYYRDINGDGRIDADDLSYDNKPRGAILQYGIPFSIGYKGIFLEGLIQGTGPQYGLVNPNIRGTGAARLHFQNQLDFYYPGNPNARLPRADDNFGAWNGETNRADSQLWMVNKTYVRFKNLNIGYDLTNLLKRNRIFTRARLSFAATNLFTISPANDYYDPETGADQLSAYPITKTYSLVLNVGF